MTVQFIVMLYIFNPMKMLGIAHASLDFAEKATFSLEVALSTGHFSSAT